MCLFAVYEPHPPVNHSISATHTKTYDNIKTILNLNLTQYNFAWNYIGEYTWFPGDENPL